MITINIADIDAPVLKLLLQERNGTYEREGASFILNDDFVYFSDGTALSQVLVKMLLNEFFP